MNNKKKITIVFVVLAIVCVFAVLVFSGVIDLGAIGGGDEESTGSDSSYSFDAAAYANNTKGEGTVAVPYLDTGIDDVFYTMTTDGEVKFYKYNEGVMTETEPTGTYKASVVMSETTITADITYYTEDGKITGFGLYKGAEGEFNLYPYAFFCLRDYGERYTRGADGSCYLLVDTTEEDFYSNNKTYEEPFIFYLDDSSAERLLSEANRTVGLNGTKRADYSMINDAAIAGSWDRQLFFSGRHYAEADETVDLLRSGGNGNNTDNILIASDVLGNWATYIKGGILYLAEDGSGNVALMEYSLDSETAQVKKVFSGIKRDDILVSGNYVFIISANTVYSIDDDKESPIALGITGEFKADKFEAAEGTIVLRGYVDGAYPTVVAANPGDGAVKALYTNNRFKDVVNVSILGNGDIMLAEKTGSGFTYSIF